jgi:hypothetical protein
MCVIFGYSLSDTNSDWQLLRQNDEEVTGWSGESSNRGFILRAREEFS